MDIGHVAKLANLGLTAEEEKIFSRQLSETFKTIDLINDIDTTGVDPTSQVTGLANIVRPDEIDPGRLIPQPQVLSQAKKTHNGYIVVPAVFDEH